MLSHISHISHISHFILTEEGKECFSIILYALNQLIRLIIQHPAISSKCFTAHVATVCLFSQTPLVSALNEQTKV
jgi:hypothetical protein